MKQIEYILKLISTLNEQVAWLDKAKEILLASDARDVYEEPRRMYVYEILADSRIRLKSLKAANCASVGFDKLIY